MMKNVKFVVWFIVLIIIQTVVSHYIRIYDVSPVLILPFVLIAALLEDSFPYAAVLGIIGGITAGTFLGKNFFVSTLIVSISAILLFNCRKKAKYVPNIIKAVIWTVAVTFIWETASFGYLYRSFAGYGDVILSETLVSVIYNSVMALIIYPVLKRTVYNEEKERKLIL